MTSIDGCGDASFVSRRKSSSLFSRKKCSLDGAASSLRAVRRIIRSRFSATTMSLPARATRP
jgi:hypothetical protein